MVQHALMAQVAVTSDGGQDTVSSPGSSNTAGATALLGNDDDDDDDIDPIAIAALVVGLVSLLVSFVAVLKVLALSSTTATDSAPKEAAKDESSTAQQDQMETKTLGSKMVA